jgi:serine phosphatase RsbU (regulator of sigma subunit)
VVEARAARKRYFSLRLRLVTLVALISLPWLALVLYTQADERRVANAHVNDDAMRVIRIVASNQAAQIEGARQLLGAFERLTQLRGSDVDACHAFLVDMLVTSPSFINFIVVASDGKVLCSAVTMSAAVDVADRPYFVRATQTKRFAVGDYQVGRITHQPSIGYAQPILDGAGNVRAVLVAVQNLDWLGAALSDVPFPSGAVLVVTDGNGTVLAHVPDRESWVGRTLPEEHVLASLSSAKGGGIVEADDAQGVRRLWAYAPLLAGVNLHATMGVPKSIAFADIESRFRRNLAALAVVTLAALGAAWFGGGFFIVRQVDALVAATRRLASGELGTRAPLVGGRSELALLAQSFNDMAATLEARDRELRLAEERTRAAEIDLAVTHAQMDIARQIQKSLLPDDPLSGAGVLYAGRCIPATAVGGDYFGYFPRGPTTIDSFVGDVSGHGVGAALLMAEARTTFLAERLVAPSAAQILAKLNELLHDDLDRAQLFMTACCATFDTGTRVLSYANAGHPPALLLRAGESTCAALNADGCFLGVQRDLAFTEVKVRLAAGDIVVFYTDGITEAQDVSGQFYGVDRLNAAIAAHRDEDPEPLVASVLGDLDRFGGAVKREDDVTIVVMKLTA